LFEDETVFSNSVYRCSFAGSKFKPSLNEQQDPPRHGRTEAFVFKERRSERAFKKSGPNRQRPSSLAETNRINEKINAEVRRRNGIRHHFVGACFSSLGSFVPGAGSPLAESMAL
jgi:hypothetical protein